MNKENIYSYSKLTCFDKCRYNYYLTYVKGFRNGETIYTFMGSKCHEILELLQQQKVDNQIACEMFYEALEEADMLGLTWMSDNVRTNYVVSMNHFFEHYARIDKQYEIEKKFVIDINGIKLRGFIDLSIFEDGYVDVIDYKTSTKFSSSSLPIYGRQLVLYAYALKQLNPDIEIRMIAWNMLKYGMIQGPRKIKPEIRANIDEGQWFEPYMLEWKYNDETVTELVEFITDTVNSIESCTCEQDYTCCDLDKNSYSCRSICDNSIRCKHYIEHCKKFSSKS